MGYELSVEDRGGYLHVRVTGENSPQAVRGYLADLRTICIERGSDAVLIEESLQGPGLALLEIFQIASEGCRHGLEIGRIAFVDVVPEHSAADMQFAETVAVNRGLNIRRFRTVQDAERWLLEAPSQRPLVRSPSQ